jgi:hypothetical protein
LDWLSYFGEVKTNLFKDTHEESDDSSDDLPPVRNGIYSVKMKLTKDMPQLIPMHGKRVRLYYRDITKRCTNTHQRKQCKNEKVTWFNYVKQFAQIYPDIPKIMYGKWANMAEKLSPEGHEDIRVTVNSNMDNQAAASASEHGSLIAKPGQSQGVRVKDQGGEIGDGGRDGDGGGNEDRDGTETEREEGEETGEEQISQLVKSLQK